MPNNDDKRPAEERPPPPPQPPGSQPEQPERPPQRTPQDEPRREARFLQRPSAGPHVAAAASVGGQVILEPDSEAAKAARGGVYRTQLANAQHRDEDLVKHGLDPVDCTGG